MKKCPFCLCEFVTDADFKNHMETFGYDKDKHLQKLEKIHTKAWSENFQ